MKNLLRKFGLPDKSLKILALLFSGDILFITLHIVHKLARLYDLMIPAIHQEAFNLFRELGLAESFQYVKEFWIAILLVWLIFKEKKFSYSGWALLFTYILLDDMLSIHESFSGLVITKLGFLPMKTIVGGLRHQDFGELGISTLVGLVFICLSGISYLKSDRETRNIFHYLFAGLLLITIFGVGFDFVGQLITKDTKILYELTHFIEDGGEMLAMTITCWYVYTLTEITETLPRE